MRKLLLLVILCMFERVLLAQCTPYAGLNHSGIYPSQVPEASVGTAYNQTITFKFPRDTNYLGQSAHIDTIIIKSVTGLPASIAWTCNVANCTYTDDSLKGCVQLIGTPVTGDAGVTKIRITVDAKVTVTLPPPASPIHTTVPFNDSSQTFTVKDPNVGIMRADKAVSNVFGVDQNYPNPVMDETEFSFTSPKAEKTVIKIYDLLGKEVFQVVVNAKAGKNSVVVNLEDLKPGYYMYSVSNSAGSKTKRLSKKQ